MELFDITITIPIREVLMPEKIMELFPHNIPFIDLLHLLKVLPPYECSSSQIEDGYPSLHISREVLDFEIYSHPHKPSFSFFTVLYLTIKGRRPYLLKLIM